jgi:hypothetical protein
MPPRRDPTAQTALYHLSYDSQDNTRSSGTECGACENFRTPRCQHCGNTDADKLFRALSAIDEIEKQLS